MRQRTRGVVLAAWGLVAVVALAGMSMAQEQKEAGKVRERSEIEQKYLWAVEAIYPDEAAWEKDYEHVAGQIDKLAALKGTLSKGPDALLKALQLREEVAKPFEKAFVYAFLISDQDTRENKPQGMKDRLRNLAVRYGEAMAWFEPELTAIDLAKIKEWMGQNQDLAVYAHYFDNVFRQKKYILSEREEQLIALGGQVAATPHNAYDLLINADIKMPSIKDEKGQDFEVTDSAFYILMGKADRRVRKDGYEAIVGTYKGFRNTAAALLNGEVQTHIFNVRARGYESCLQASLSPSNIPAGVYNNLIQTVNTNLPLLHRYTTLRKNLLKLEDGVHDYDLYVPLTSAVELKYTYEEAVAEMLKAFAPLGPAYVAEVKKGVDSRWIDVFPTKGKQSGAYSSGTYLTQPYILLNFYGRYEDVSTLAHEMGHSMHSFLSRQTQPYVYADYDIFCAEVASVTNEILLQQHVLKQIKDPQTKLYLLSQFLEGFRGTVFRQTLFSEFEQAVHEMAEKGQPLTADSLGAAYGGIMKKYYGADYLHDELVDNYWIRIPHFYRNFYVYKYSTSYCAAANIAARIQKGDPQVVEAYLTFLKSGGSKYPIELLKGAGVDMTSPQPIDDAMKLFEGWLAEAEKVAAELKLVAK
ncbi:MAG: oligoendopeptidase F [Planctomycetota bacterium]